MLGLLFYLEPDGIPQIALPLESPALMKALAEGRYRAVFQIGKYYKDAHVQLPLVPFLDVVTFDFGIDDPQQHYHLPMKCTPWGYSCFRGGA